MVRAVVAGAAGQMGKRVIQAIYKTEGIELVGALERVDHDFLDQDAGLVAGISLLTVPIKSMVEPKYDVLIDFTNHQAAITHLRAAADWQKAIVIGTTGFTSEERKKIEEIAPQTRSLIAPNMSLGVNLLFQVLGDVAKVLSTYDVEISEAHHRLKKDAPSGTAIKMGEVIAQAKGQNLNGCAVYCRKGHTGPRTDHEIGFQVVRAGDIVGEHTVIFAGPGERIEITHRVHSRDVFAQGAVRAAIWLVNQPAGLYAMEDMLGLK